MRSAETALSFLFKLTGKCNIKGQALWDDNGITDGSHVYAATCWVITTTTQIFFWWVSDKRKQHISIIRNDMLLFVNSKIISLVDRGKKNSISIWYNSCLRRFTWIWSEYFLQQILTKLVAHLWENNAQSGCRFTRMIFSPRMKSWLTCRVWTLPYLWESFFWWACGSWAFSVTVCSSCLTASDSSDSAVLLFPLTLAGWADEPLWVVLGSPGWYVLFLSWVSCCFAGPSPLGFSWIFSFSKSCI